MEDEINAVLDERYLECNFTGHRLPNEEKKSCNYCGRRFTYSSSTLERESEIMEDRLKGLSIVRNESKLLLLR